MLFTKKDIMDISLKKYLEEVEKELQLIYSQNETAAIMASIQAGITEYITEHPSYTIDDIKEFVKIDSLFSDWAENASANEVLDKINSSFQKKRIFLVLIALFIAIILFFIVTFSIRYWMMESAWNNIKIIP